MHLRRILRIRQRQKDIKLKASVLVRCAFRCHDTRFEKIRSVLVYPDKYSRRPLDWQICRQSGNFACDTKHTPRLDAGGTGGFPGDRTYILVISLAGIHRLDQCYVLKPMLLHHLQVRCNFLCLGRRRLVVSFRVRGFYHASSGKLQAWINNGTDLPSILDRLVDLCIRCNDFLTYLDGISSEITFGGSTRACPGKDRFLGALHYFALDVENLKQGLAVGGAIVGRTISLKKIVQQKAGVELRFAKCRKHIECCIVDGPPFAPFQEGIILEQREQKPIESGRHFES
mmetsp:Transcript_26755/g.58549  ORF Transcript_26755/g.58549 Transcript_26755/m.58549 type:complete len:286 (-) Transcript_26755:935-1792(-)